MNGPQSVAIDARAAVALIAVLSAGCATAARQEPATDTWVAPSFRHAVAVEAVRDGAWWRQFGDPVLVALVERAVSANLDVRVAVERAAAARAGESFQASRLRPTVGVQVATLDARSGLPASVKQVNADTVAVRAGADVAWEIDLAGGLRSAHRASQADGVAAEAGIAGARLLVASEVARQYYILRGAQERLRIVEQLAGAQRDTDRLVRSRERQGLASRFDVSRSSAEAEALDAQIPPLRTLVGVTESRIAVVLGQNPSAFAVEDAAFSWPLLEDIRTGQPSELLRRRPDLMAAEARVTAEGLRLDEARAQWWPKVFLSALVGGQGLRLNGVNLSPVPFSNVALAFAQPLLDGGRIEAGIALQSARANEALAEWQRAVLVAVEEVENSLLVRKEEIARGRLLTSALDARRQSLVNAQSLHREGQTDLLVLLDVQRALLAAELDLTESRTQQALNDVQLYKSLGGGWTAAAAIGSASIP